MFTGVNTVHMFINEDAKLAVKRGINWLDENHPGWEMEIDLSLLNMSECEECVIGQAVGDYSKVTRAAAGTPTEAYSGKAAVWAVEHGFECPGVVAYQEFTGNRSASYTYRELDVLWSDEVQRRLG